MKGQERATRWPDTVWRWALLLFLGLSTVTVASAIPPVGAQEGVPLLTPSVPLQAGRQLMAQAGGSPASNAGQQKASAIPQDPPIPSIPITTGKDLITKLGCPVCHEIKGHETTVREEAPDLTFEGELIRPDWLFAFLKAPFRIRPAISARMPNFRLTDQEALALTEYLVTLKDDEVPEFPNPKRHKDKKTPPAFVEAGRQLTSKNYLDCFTCHILGTKRPEGDPAEWAPDLTRVRQRLDTSGILSWIRNPPRYRPGTKMPVFFEDEDSGPDDILEGDEEHHILALRDFVLSVGQDRQFDGYRKAKAAFPNVTRAQGRSLMVKLNCVGCHNVEYLPDGKKVGPSLNAEGGRVKKKWLYEFLKRPRTIKPEYAIMGSLARMPNFRLTDEEAKLLTDYIGKVLVDETVPSDFFSNGIPANLIPKGRRLFAEKRCNNCHRIGVDAGGIGPVLTKVEERLNPGWIYRFVLKPTHFLDTRMPNLKLTEAEARAVTAYLMSRKEP